METNNGVKAVYAPTRKEWRSWLEENHQSEKSVCLIIYHKNSKVASVYYDESVEEALCFGWIDSKANKRDEESYYLYFARRKPKSNWSKANRERVARMTDQGLMTQAGQVYIDIAKETGTWDALENPQNAVIPDDLQKLFDENKTALENFLAFSASSKRMILEWILNAKRPETREKRITQTVELAEKNIKSKV